MARLRASTEEGRPVFKDLLFRKSSCMFVAFDLLFLNVHDLCTLRSDANMRFVPKDLVTVTHTLFVVMPHTIPSAAVDVFVDKISSPIIVFQYRHGTT